MLVSAVDWGCFFMGLVPITARRAVTTCLRCTRLAYGMFGMEEGVSAVSGSVPSLILVAGCFLLVLRHVVVVNSEV